MVRFQNHFGGLLGHLTRRQLSLRAMATGYASEEPSMIITEQLAAVTPTNMKKRLCPKHFRCEEITFICPLRVGPLEKTVGTLEETRKFFRETSKSTLETPTGRPKEFILAAFAKRNWFVFHGYFCLR